MHGLLSGAVNIPASLILFDSKCYFCWLTCELNHSNMIDSVPCRDSFCLAFHDVILCPAVLVLSPLQSKDHCHFRLSLIQYCFLYNTVI